MAAPSSTAKKSGERVMVGASSQHETQSDVVQPPPLEALFRCALCKSRMTRCAMVVTCSHVFCFDCVNKAIEHGFDPSQVEVPAVLGHSPTAKVVSRRKKLRFCCPICHLTAFKWMLRPVPLLDAFLKTFQEEKAALSQPSRPAVPAAQSSPELFTESGWAAVPHASLLLYPPDPSLCPAELKTNRKRCRDVQPGSVNQPECTLCDVHFGSQPTVLLHRSVEQLASPTPPQGDSPKRQVAAQSTISVPSTLRDDSVISLAERGGL